MEVPVCCKPSVASLVKQEYGLDPSLFTRKFVKKSSNSIITVRPPVVIFDVDAQSQSKCVQNVVTIINMSPRCQFCAVMPLQNQQFHISGRLQTRILPGQSWPIKVTFDPSKSVYGRTWMHIFCLEDDNLMILLEAVAKYPCAPLPKFINFGTVPLCERVSHKFHISSIGGKTVVFGINMLQSHNDISVTPLKGVVEENGIDIEVKYQPTQYSTAICNLQVFLPIISLTPFTISVTGSCKPNIGRDRMEKYQKSEGLFLKKCQRELNDLPILATTRELVSEAKHLPKKTKLQTKPKELNSIPLNSLFGMAKLFNKKELKILSPYILLGPVGQTVEQDLEVKRIHEEIFKKNCMSHSEFNNASVIIRHDTTKLGDTVDDKISDIVEEHISNWQKYKEMTELTSDDVSQAKLYRQRNIKDPEEFTKYQFSDVPSSEWFVRYQPLSRFIQSARAIIVQNRLKIRFDMMKVGPPIEQSEDQDIQPEEQQSDHLIRPNKFVRELTEFDEESQEEVEQPTVLLQDQQSKVLKVLYTNHVEEPKCRVKQQEGKIINIL